MATEREVEESLSAIALELEEFDERLEFAERRVRAIRLTNFIEDFLSGGKDLTAGGWFVSSHLDWKLVSSPANPGTGFIRIFADTDNSNHLTQLDSSGAEIDLVYLDADAIAAVEGEGTLDLTGEVTIASGKSLTLKTDGSSGGVKFGSSGDVILYRGAANKLYLGTGDSLRLVSGTLETDTIGEVAGGAGVTIDSVLLKDGLVDGVDVEAHNNAYNGSFLEPMTFVVASNGSTITGTLDKNPTGDLTEVFSDGYSTMSSGTTVSLVAGSATVPKKNYIYVLQSNKGVLVASDSGWPSAEHIKVAEVVVQTAALVASNGILANRFWNDHAQDTNGQGHHLHTWERLRWEHSAYKSGSAVTWTGSGGATLDLAITAGKAYQMHLHTVAAFDTTDPDNVYVVNHPTAYTITPDIETLVVDSDNDSLSNKYYNLVVWVSVSSGSEAEKVFINLPSGSYTKQADAENDVSGYDNFDIPTDYRGYAYLVQRVTIKHSTAGGGTWTIGQETDLRGTVPSIAVGGGTLAITTEFADNAFKLFDEGDPTKELAFQLSGISASTTRTITVPDEDLSLINDATSDPLIDADAASDGTEGSLARKDHVHPKHHAKYLDSAAISAVEGEATLDLTGNVTIQDGTASRTLSILVTDDANPMMKLSKDRLEFGAGGASALDSIFKRSVTGGDPGIFDLEKAAAGIFLRGVVTGESHPRWTLDQESINFGSGSATEDITLGRTLIGTLGAFYLFALDSGVEAGPDQSDYVRSTTTGLALRLFKIAGSTKEANARARYAHDRIEFGAGDASALDVNLYRNAANELKTDDKFIIGAGLDVTGNIVVSGLVDGVDIATRDHAKYTNSEAIAAVEGEATLVLSGDLTLQGSLISTWGDLTIASGQVAVTKMMHTLAGEGGANDNLVGMSGGSDGMMVILHAVSDAVTITLKHNDVGGESSDSTRLFMADNADITLDDVDDLVIMVFDSSLDTGGAWIVLVAGGGGVGAHDMLSASHSDTAAAAVSRGSFIVGNSTPDWSELTIGTARQVMTSDGTDAAWTEPARAFGFFMG